MFKAIFFKEWVKLRWSLLVLLVITFAIHLKTGITIRSAIISQGAYHLWYVASIKKSVFYSTMMWLGPFVGLVTALAQFVPETSKQRLRILFHLPLAHNQALAAMLCSGALSLGALSLVSLSCLALCIAIFFPGEVVKAALLTAFPWWLASVPAYFGTALALVETALWRKVVYGIMAFYLTQLMLADTLMGFELSIWAYVIVFSFYLPTVMLPAYRFKRGIV